MIRDSESAAESLDELKTHLMRIIRIKIAAVRLSSRMHSVVNRQFQIACLTVSVLGLTSLGVFADSDEVKEAFEKAQSK